jgi:hypothetical protein
MGDLAMRRSGTVRAAWLIGIIWLCASASPALADQAPFWESPVGLVPGNPDIQVRMAAETVDIDVVERGDEVHAVVKASFTMVNDGADATVKVGFPASTTSLFDQLVEPDADGRRFADAPVLFSPEALRAFQVSVDGQQLRSWRQEVPAAAEAGFGANWLMWEMAFPAGRTTTVDVAYEQVLSERTRDRVVQPMYVLRTGALWSGTIGEATVTMRAPDGGALVGGAELFMRTDDAGGVTTYPRADQVYGPADAVSASPTQIVWRFADLEPTRDVGATYVRAAAWREFAEADQAIRGGDTSDPDTLRRAARAAFEILGGAEVCGSAGDLICIMGPHRVPRGLVDRFAQPGRERAQRALQLGPTDPESLLLAGDYEYWFAMPQERNHGELQCWPSQAVDAYETALGAGAPGALPRLAGIRVAAQQVRAYGAVRISTCSGRPDRRLEAELIKATVEQGNAAWSSAVRRQGTAERYPDLFAGTWLDVRTDEVNVLRRNRQNRETTMQSVEYGDVMFTDETSATIETVESWLDKTYSESGELLRDLSGRLRQRYELKNIDGLWKIVDAAIVRD